MKRGWVVVALVIIAAFSAAYQKRSARNLYLKEETMLRHLKKEPFLTKKASPWMVEQIQEDFQGISEISKFAVDAAFEQIRDQSPMLVRYRIIDQKLYRYFVENEPISLKDNSTEKAIKTLLQKSRFKDMDFIISYFDAYPLSNISPDELKVPLLVSAKLRNAAKGILIPDWRSIGHWWMSDIKAIKQFDIPWENKKELAFWRGGFTKKNRTKLCQLSIDHPDYLNARLVGDSKDPEWQKQCEESGYLGSRCSWSEFLEHKYLPYMDGVMCAAPALQWRLLSHSLTFKPDSEEIQWFYRAIHPNVHYVPVKNDLSDLPEKIDWAKGHDESARKIVERANEFAENHLRYGDVLHYFLLVLKEYGLHQNLNRAELKKEVESDPRWVDIQYRGEVRGKAEKKHITQFSLESTPF